MKSLQGTHSFSTIARESEMKLAPINPQCHFYHKARCTTCSLNYELIVIFSNFVLEIRYGPKGYGFGGGSGFLQTDVIQYVIWLHDLLTS